MSKAYLSNSLEADAPTGLQQFAGDLRLPEFISWFSPDAVSTGECESKGILQMGACNVPQSKVFFNLYITADVHSGGKHMR